MVNSPGAMRTMPGGVPGSVVGAALALNSGASSKMTPARSPCMVPFLVGGNPKSLRLEPFVRDADPRAVHRHVPREVVLVVVPVHGAVADVEVPAASELPV